MDSPYDVLYNRVRGREGLMRWLRDLDTVKDYVNRVGRGVNLKEQLQTCLKKEDRELFSTYCENAETAQDYEQQMLSMEGQMSSLSQIPAVLTGNNTRADP